MSDELADRVDPTVVEYGFICTLCGDGERCAGPIDQVEVTSTRSETYSAFVTYLACTPCRETVAKLVAEGAWNVRSPWTMRAAIIAGNDPIATVRAEAKELREKAAGRKPRHLTTVP